eukprot:TRINITY_DN74857_c0_g1_i1.p1 TRINITY_DN74857_c0_g1~~TRINITY_DN74857_c0_g1_i1.p1  ORF type:complete len:611 (-),score=78.57 TRINITY_DN74857_c0_g1_i1:34-1866(-)
MDEEAQPPRRSQSSQSSPRRSQSAAQASRASRASVAVSSASNAGANGAVKDDFMHRIAICVAGYFLVSALAAPLTYLGRSAWTLGAALYLSLVPTSGVLWYLLNRHVRSATRRQTAISFSEMAAWMFFILLVFIDPVDMLVAGVAHVEVPFGCDYSKTSGIGFLETIKKITDCADPKTLIDGQPCDDLGHWNLEASNYELYQTLGFCEGKCLTMPFYQVYGLEAERAKLEGNDACRELTTQAYESIGALEFVSVKWQGEADPKQVEKPINSKDALNAAWTDLKAVTAFKAPGTVRVEFQVKAPSAFNVIFTAFFWAIVTESIRCFVIRRLICKDRVADLNAIIIYALATGAGSAAAENLWYTYVAIMNLYSTEQLYALNQGFLVFYRMAMNTPLHAVLSLIIAMHYSYRKFLGRGYHLVSVAAGAVIIHALYDLSLLLDRRTLGEPVSMGLAFVIWACGVAYLFQCWKPVENVCTVDVRALEESRRVSEPRSCVSECGVCLWLVPQRDARLLEVQQIEEQAAIAESRRSGRARPSVAAQSATALVRASKANLLPEPATCQTREADCTNCGRRIRAHLVYPSNCPFCGAAAPSPPLSDAPTDRGRASGIGI